MREFFNEQTTLKKEKPETLGFLHNFWHLNFNDFQCFMHLTKYFAASKLFSFNF